MAQVRSGMATRRAGLWSQFFHGFAFTPHQALHKIARCQSTPKLCISLWCLTSHHLSELLANKALWILMAFCWLLVPTGCDENCLGPVSKWKRGHDLQHWIPGQGIEHCGISVFQRQHTKHLIGAWRIHHWTCCFRLTVGLECNYTS